MTLIDVYVKKGKVKHKKMHWREALTLLADVKKFNGKEKEFLFIDEDEKKIVSSQTCFNLLNMDINEIQNVLSNYNYKEL